MKNLRKMAAVWCCVAALGGFAQAGETDTNSCCDDASCTNLVSFEDVNSLLRTNLDGITGSSLSQPALQSLLAKLGPRATLVPSGADNSAVDAMPLKKSALYDGGYAYFQVARVSGQLAAQFSEAYSQMASTNQGKIKGAILDLRFATGADYAAAAAVADKFVTTGQPLLDWGAGSASAKAKTNAITTPLIVLINGRTADAAEALAAVLREAAASVLIGQPTAGQAGVSKEFPLADGSKLRVATAPVKIAGRMSLSEPVRPDLVVASAAEDERVWLDDPFKVPAKTAATGAASLAIGTETEPGASRVRHRINEAELVYEQRHGSGNSDPLPARPSSLKPEAAPPLVADPALSRALDLLKAEGIMALSRTGP